MLKLVSSAHEARCREERERQRERERFNEGLLHDELHDHEATQGARVYWKINLIL